MQLFTHLLYVMTAVLQELLPESYLLLLTPGPVMAPELALAQGLHSASRSGRAAVWIDCELVHDLSVEAVRMLWDYHFRLQEQNIQLVVVHASDVVKQELIDWQPEPSLCFVPTLFDAAWQTGVRQVA